MDIDTFNIMISIAMFFLGVCVGGAIETARSIKKSSKKKLNLK